MRLVIVAAFAAVLAPIAIDRAAPIAAAPSCEGLTSQARPSATITQAQVIEAGTFTLPTGAQPSPAPVNFGNLPAFCRAAATLKPSADSNIKIEVWLPVSGWNGKFLGVGNGGWAGAISYPALAGGLSRGYAVASTDTGHAGSGGDGSFAFGHPEKLTDFAYRAVHEMTVHAKALVNGYYGSAPRLSYWNGCSTGGRQGLKEAQKYPADYDGIFAGAPANFMTHLSAQALWVAHATLKDPASYVPREKFAVIHKAVLEACDALDGVKDGVLEDPTRCRFDPAALQCRGEEAAQCLTPPQVEAVRKIYGAVKNPRTGVEIFPGLEPGSELGWSALAGGPNPFSISTDHFKYVVFKNPSWDFKTFDFDKDVELADRLDAGLTNANDPDLRAFFGRGGRLLMYHGWNDQLIAPRNSVNYYRSVMSAVGAIKAAESIRLFMVPGMTHCAGGEGTSVFAGMPALEHWVEEKVAPEQIAASHVVNGVADRTRPLCPYPKIAAYTGTGSTDDAANFVCKTP
jgi:feruloyl esterase